MSMGERRRGDPQGIKSYRLKLGGHWGQADK